MKRFTVLALAGFIFLASCNSSDHGSGAVENNHSHSTDTAGRRFDSTKRPMNPIPDTNREQNRVDIQQRDSTK